MNIMVSEWTKFRTIRSTWWTVVTLAALPVGVAVLVALTGSLAPDDTVLAGALGNAVVGLVPAGILGALLASGEHGGGTIRLTIAAIPRRWPVLAAKAALAASGAFVVALVANGVGLAVAAALLPDHQRGTAPAALIGIALIYAAVAVLGVALGSALRSPAGSVTAVTGLLLAPALLGPLLGRVPWLVSLTPFGAAQRVLSPSVVAGAPDGWVCVAVVCLGGVAAGAAATWVLLRRDV